MVKSLSLVCVYLLLIGCATGAVPTPHTPLSGNTAQSSLLQQAQPGQSITVYGLDATVLEEYVAASGRSCKKLLIASDQSVRVACRKPAGEWYLRKPLHRSAQLATSKPAPPRAPETAPELAIQRNEPAAADNTVSLGNVANADPERSRSVAQDENLWRFSKRVTGNALNWQRIAQYNQITNVTALKTGVQLAIPPEIAILPDAG